MSIFKNNLIVGIASGLVAVVIAPVLIPALKKSGRPLAKSLVKGGVMLYDKGRQAVADAGEVIEDVIAEVQAETYEKQMMAAASVHQVATQESGGNGLDAGAERRGATLAPREEGEAL
ncbi:MAG: DUF5132 domain-containing protein [Burkholderiaceae bacterium]|nr:DUF5132 domain-containing protein [Burkholderiaceae bacterium]